MYIYIYIAFQKNHLNIFIVWVKAPKARLICSPSFSRASVRGKDSNVHGRAMVLTASSPEGLVERTTASAKQLGGYTWILKKLLVQKIKKTTLLGDYMFFFMCEKYQLISSWLMVYR